MLVGQKQTAKRSCWLHRSFVDTTVKVFFNASVAVAFFEEIKGYADWGSAVFVVVVVFLATGGNGDFS